MFKYFSGKCFYVKMIILLILDYVLTHLLTGCGSLVVVLLLGIREVMSSSPARADHVKFMTFEIGSDCSFAKSTAFRSENNVQISP
jgi:hypothetical protein